MWQMKMNEEQMNESPNDNENDQQWTENEWENKETNDQTWPIGQWIQNM